jgi:hypothetical protein
LNTSQMTRRYTYHEARLQDAIVAMLEWLGICHTVTDASRVWGPDGKPRKSKVDKDWPDILIVFDGGTAGFIETKSKRGVLSDGQKMKIALLKSLSARVIVPRSVEEVYQWLAGCPLNDPQRQRYRAFRITLPASSSTSQSAPLRSPRRTS